MKSANMKIIILFLINVVIASSPPKRLSLKELAFVRLGSYGEFSCAFCCVFQKWHFYHVFDILSCSHNFIVSDLFREKTRSCFNKTYELILIISYLTFFCFHLKYNVILPVMTECMKKSITCRKFRRTGWKLMNIANTMECNLHRWIRKQKRIILFWCWFQICTFLRELALLSAAWVVWMDRKTTGIGLKTENTLNFHLNGCQGNQVVS